MSFAADDARALELLAIYNAERSDLNCIEKARLIDRLCQPTEQDGGGLTREQAAKIYGLETGAAASNLVGLLKLPKVWQDRVASGEFPQTFARLLVPYAHAPRLMDAIDRDYRADMKAGGYRAETWATRSDVERGIHSVVDDNVRPVDKSKRKYRLDEKHGYHWGDYPMLFKLTPELEADLGIVELVEGNHSRRVATNVALYDKHQLPLIIEKAKAKNKLGASRTDDKAKDRKKTPAELKAAAKRAEEILASRITAWRHGWLRSVIAEQLRADVQGLDWIKVKIVLWLASQVSFGSQGKEAIALPSVICQAVGFVYKPHYAGDEPGADEVWEALCGKFYKKAGYSDHLAGLTNAAKAIVLKLFATEDHNPDYPNLPHEVVDGVAADLGVDLFTECGSCSRRPIARRSKLSSSCIPATSSTSSGGS
jgi:hypothetical protein